VSHFSAPCWLICCWSIPANLLHSNKSIRYMLKRLLSPCYSLFDSSSRFPHAFFFDLLVAWILTRPLSLLTARFVYVYVYGSVSLSYALRDQIEFSILFKNDFETKKRKGFIDLSLSPNAPCVVKQILGIFLELLCVYLSACSVSSCDVQFLVAKSISHRTQIHF
jgi:hypothetical protein